MSNNFEVDSILINSGAVTASFTGADGNTVNVEYRELSGFELISAASGNNAKAGSDGSVTFSPEFIKRVVTDQVVSVDGNKSTDIWLEKATPSVITILFNLIMGGDENPKGARE